MTLRSGAPTTRHPAQRLVACLLRRVAKRLFRGRRTKPAKIETFFRGRAQKSLSIKESIFAGFASLLEQGRAASHPNALARRDSYPSPPPPAAHSRDWRKILVAVNKIFSLLLPPNAEKV